MIKDFLDTTYFETQNLLNQAREYNSLYLGGDSTTLSPLETLVLVKEMIRVTAQLTDVMAWLLYYRAAQKGEIAFDALTDHPLTVYSPPLNHREIPFRAQKIIERSHALYKKVWRISRQVNKNSTS